MPRRYRSLKLIHKNKAGNIAMVFAMVTPILLLFVGISFDFVKTRSLKERLQAATDGANLTVAKRLSAREIALNDAEGFATDFLKSQLVDFSDRYPDLVYNVTADISEIIDRNITTWNVSLNVEANIQANRLSSFINNETMNVTINSVSTTKNEDVQGAFSMSVVIDVSASMDLPTDENLNMQDILDDNRANADRLSANIYEAHYVYGLQEEQIIYIMQNYRANDCRDMKDTHEDRVTFLQSIGKPISSDAKLAYNYCYHPAYAAEKVDVDKIVANWDAVFTNIAASKIRLIKDAASNMLDQMAAADRDEKYVRTGAVTYQSILDDQIELGWGISETTEFINNLKANGGTSSTDAMGWAFDMLRPSNSTETREHLQKNGQLPDRFIVFMTDGENNYSSDDAETQSICDHAKDNGITIFTVAFAAPEYGQALLSYCATSPDHYFEPETAGQLVDVFEHIGRKTTNTLIHLTM